MREHKRSQPVHPTHFRLRTPKQLLVVRDNAELLGNGEGVVIHHEGGIVAVLSVLAGMPEPLVPRPPLSDRRVSLPLPHGVGEVDVVDLDDADIGNLDQGDRESRRVDDYLPVAGATAAVRHLRDPGIARDWDIGVTTSIEHDGGLRNDAFGLDLACRLTFLSRGRQRRH